MKSVDQAMRLRRFRVLPKSDLEFIIETRTGHMLRLKPDNCSLSGIGGTFDQTVDIPSDLQVGEIVPSSKLIWKNHEYSLGRLVVRRLMTQDGGKFIGFSLIDSRLPIRGALSKHLVVDSNVQFPYEVEIQSEKFSLADFARSGDPGVDLFSKCREFQIYHQQWKSSPKYQYHTVRMPSKGTRVNLARERTNRRNDYLVLSSYDYLGLAAHPQVLEAAKKAIDQYGLSSTGSPVVTGLTQAHEELSEIIAKMVQKEAVLLFSSGFSANIGTLGCLAVDQDLIVADILAHASLQDGMQSSKATSRFFKHNDVKHLTKILNEYRPNHNGALVVTEGVFSMDGDVAPIRKIITATKSFNCRVFVDEAHSFGIYGPNHAGICDRENVLKDVDLVMASLSKTCGAGGGFLAGEQDIVDWLRFYSKPFLFSGSLSPSAAAAALISLKIIQGDKERTDRLMNNIRHFVSGLINLGVPLSDRHESPVIPVVIGNEEKLGQMNQVMMNRGVFVVPIVYPAVSKNQGRFRFSLTSELSISELDYVLATFEEAMQAADLRFESQEQAS